MMKERIPRMESVLSEKRLLDSVEVCTYLSLGRCKGIDFAKQIGAERKIGRRVLYDRHVIDKYFDDQIERC